MKRVFAAWQLMLLAFAPMASNQTQQKPVSPAETEDPQMSIIRLQQMRSEGRAAFETADYDYLLGRTAESEGNLALAMSSYQAVASRNSVLRPYALRRLSRIAHNTGNLAYEGLLLREIVATAPESLLAKGAAFRSAENTLERGHAIDTIRFLNNDQAEQSVSTAMSAKDTGARERDALLAQAYMASGQVDLARELFNRSIDDPQLRGNPDDVSLAAVRGLDAIDDKGVHLTDAEHTRRARIYQASREFHTAKVHYDAILAEQTDRPLAGDAAFQIGRGFVQRGDLVEGIKWFERVLEQFAETPAAKDALLQAASAYGRVGKTREAISRYQQFIEKYPLDEKVERAYLNIVDIYRDHGEDSEALKWCRKTSEVFRGRVAEAVAVFAEARIYICRGEWAAALESLGRLKELSDLGGPSVPGGTSSAEVNFLRGFALEQSQRFPEAIDVYLSIPEGREEFYGGRATDRLKQLSADETSRSFVSQKIGHLFSTLRSKDDDATRRHAQAILRLTDDENLRESALRELATALRSISGYREVPSFEKPPPAPASPSGETRDQHAAIAHKLLDLGIYDEGAIELEASRPRVSDKGLALATYFVLGDHADRALRLIEPAWRKMPADHPIELIPGDQLELLYPVVYKSALLRHATARNVDPRLVLAIIRQESRFQPDARSYAAARGLMQFIPATADRVAAELGWEQHDMDDLYHPSTSILFGSQYLADLFQLFPKQPEAVAASYNGGDDNMKRWLARSRSNAPERYIPEIAYGQTKDYVYKVMANYRMYKYLYDDNLQAKNAVSTTSLHPQ